MITKKKKNTALKPRRFPYNSIISTWASLIKTGKSSLQKLHFIQHRLVKHAWCWIFSYWISFFSSIVFRTIPPIHSPQPHSSAFGALLIFSSIWDGIRWSVFYSMSGLFFIQWPETEKWIWNMSSLITYDEQLSILHYHHICVLFPVYEFEYGMCVMCVCVCAMWWEYKQFLVRSRSCSRQDKSMHVLVHTL